MEMTGLRTMRSDPDQAESDRIIDEALKVALLTTRLLVAWHSGETEAQDSMQILWESFCKSRSASGPRFACGVSGHLGTGGNRTSDRCVSDDVIGTADLRGHQEDEGRIQDQT